MPSKKFKKTSSSKVTEIGKYDLVREVWTQSDDGNKDVIKTKTVKISVNKKK